MLHVVLGHPHCIINPLLSALPGVGEANTEAIFSSSFSQASDHTLPPMACGASTVRSSWEEIGYSHFRDKQVIVMLDRNLPCKSTVY